MSEWIVMNIGCIECGVSSDLVGIFSDLEEAQKIADELSSKGAWREGGQNHYEVFSLQQGIHIKQEYLDIIEGKGDLNE